MIKKDKILIPILVSVLSFNILLANNLIPAYATSFNNVTLPSGAIAQDSQMYLGGGSSNRAWWTAVTGGVLHLYTKGNNIFGTSNDNVLSGGGGYMAYDTFRNYLWVITSSTIYRFNGANNALIDATSTAIFTDPQDIVYDSTRDRMYALNRATSTIYDISASNPSSYTAWT